MGWAARTVWKVKVSTEARPLSPLVNEDRIVRNQFYTLGDNVLHGSNRVGVIDPVILQHLEPKWSIIFQPEK